MSDVQIQQVRRDAITWPPQQERKDFAKEDLVAMAATITAHGILSPIGVVRDGDRFGGIYGQRRWLATGIAGLEFVPAIVWDEPMSEAATREIRLIENLARVDLNPIEQASGLNDLMRAGNLGASEVAKRVGLKAPAVTKSLSLLKLSEPVQQMIISGVIGAGAGYELAHIEDPEEQAEFAQQVASGKLNRDALAGRIKARRRSTTVVKQAGPSRITAKLTHDRLITLRASNLTVDSVITALEELLARCRAARSKGLGLGTMLKVLADEAKAAS